MKKNKNKGFYLGDLPSNYMLKVEDDFISHIEHNGNIIPEEFRNDDNIVNKINMHNNNKN